jgi:hypothetical protein
MKSKKKHQIDSADREKPFDALVKTSYQREAYGPLFLGSGENGAKTAYRCRRLR